MDPLFEAVEEATEEAIINSITRAKTTVGHRGNVAHGINYTSLKTALEKFNQQISYGEDIDTQDPLGS